MTPPCHSFPASQLAVQIQVNLDGKRRKTEGGQAIDLSGCELLDLVQYNCKVDNPKQRESPVRCWPVQRWLRRFVASIQFVMHLNGLGIVGIWLMDLVLVDVDVRIKKAVSWLRQQPGKKHMPRPLLLLLLLLRLLLPQPPRAHNQGPI